MNDPRLRGESSNLHQVVTVPGITRMLVTIVGCPMPARSCQHVEKPAGSHLEFGAGRRESILCRQHREPERCMQPSICLPVMYS